MESETRIVYLLQKEKYVSKFGFYTIGITKDLASILDACGRNSAIISCRTIKDYDEVVNVLLLTFKFFFKAVEMDVVTFEGDIQAIYYKFEEITSQKVYIPKFSLTGIIAVSPIPLALEQKPSIPAVETANTLNDPSIVSVVDSTACSKCGRQFSSMNAVHQHLKYQKTDCSRKKLPSPDIPKI